MLNYSIVRPDKIEKVCKLLSETIINLFNNKESDLENLRKEIEKLDAKNDSPSLVEFDQNSIEIDKLIIVVDHSIFVSQLSTLVLQRLLGVC